MLKKLFKQMMEEKHDFYTYMGLYETCNDAAVRTKLHAIAMQEAQHYKELYDIVFKEDPGKTWTPVEEMLKHEAKECYEEMMTESKRFK